jgi:hypothetical protein
VTRVPFALIGVVLLVGTGTLVGSLGSPAVSEPDVERAMDRVEAESQSALRDAAMTAAHGAAGEPVTVPATTEYGNVLNSSQPFRDALRVRIYLRSRANLQRISERRHGVDVRVSLPPIENPADLRTAKRRVQIDRAGENGASLRVRLRNVTLSASRNGRPLGSRTESPTLVVSMPVLAVHDRVQLFEKRLEAGPLNPGLGRRLTARLYPVVWARGYAQYGGAPIENVLANRHVALFTNSAVLSLQRDVFGHSDPAGRHVLGRATAHAGLTDLLAGTDFPITDHLLDVHEGIGLTPPPSDVLESSGDVDPPVSPGEQVTIGVNDTADEAFLSTHARLERILRHSYSARVTVHQRVRDLGTRQIRPAEPPDPGWGHVDSSTHTTTTVREREPGPPHPAPGIGNHVLDVWGRTVVREHTTTHWWEGPEGGTKTTRSESIERTAVTFTLRGNHSLGPAPARPIASVHERGGRFDGTNLADIHGLAKGRVVTERGGIDRLAKRATDGKDVSETAVVHGQRPDGLDSWVYADLAGLRERVRNISTTTTRGNLATYHSNPPAALASILRERRDDLVDVPDTYPAVPQRARVAARTAYVDEVIGALDRRAQERSGGKATLRDRLAESGGDGHAGPIERLQAGYERRNQRDSPGALGGLGMQIDAEPAYLIRDTVSHDTIPTIERGTREHPLVVKNWNVLTLPYGDIADAIVGTLLGPDTTRLRTGAQVLHTIERNEDDVPDDVDRDRLERQVKSGTDAGARAARSTLADFNLGTGASRRATVRTAMSRWGTAGARALAVTNGSAAEAIHAAAVERWPGQLSDGTRDLLALRLEWDIEQAINSEKARPLEPTVDGTATEFRTAVRDEIASRIGDTMANATKATAEDLAGRSLGRLPSGMPVAPSPGFWYATVNLWRVEVAGEYARFAVRVPRGTPDSPGAQLHYVRDAGSVRLDVDGDGARELLGRSTRLSFRTGTEVAIAVPPGPQGVGDVDGKAVEESPGWPEPGR